MQLDLRNIELVRIALRGHDLVSARVAGLVPTQGKTSFDFGELVAAIVRARQHNTPVIAMLGGHPIKLGLSRYIIDLIERGLITHIATNGAGIIHDFELALVGGDAFVAFDVVLSGNTVVDAI